MRGEVWTAVDAPSGVVGYLVVQADVLRAAPTLLTAVVTREVQSVSAPLAIAVDDGDGGAWWVRPNLIRTLPRTSLTQRISTLGEAAMAVVDDSLATVLGLAI